ncbi:MAG: DUF1385 domain-containing protein [Candidatus Lernaella stagnicola]|nr:DUF1385 domain-containing protein [Candidatus Lernaella stagnicola]
MPDKQSGPLAVGGQALLEGVMMRSPNSMAVVCRRPDGQIVLKEEQWISIWNRLKFLRKPFLRGAIVLVEAMWNGIGALTFSAKIFAEEEVEEKDDTTQAEDAGGESESSPEESPKKDKDQGLSSLSIGLTIAFSITAAMALFMVLPHLATAYVGALFGKELTVDMVSFHLVDGVIKISVFFLYVWAISFMPDIKRTFMYHGAEHMAISAFDQGKTLTVENVRPYSTLHPRCGTSFIIIVLLSSILLFSMMFPFMPKLETMPKILRHLVYIAVKLPLLFPIAGVSYEIIRLAGKYRSNPLLRLATWPGLMTQKITTKKPTDDMLEISILSLKKCLWREKRVQDGEETAESSEVVYPNFQAAVEDLGCPEHFFEGGSIEIQ